MTGLLLASLLGASSPTDTSVLRACRPLLTRKAGGEIATLEVHSSTVNSAGRTFRGRLTAFQGMGPPPPGAASTHHLIRVEYRFTCRVRGGRARAASVTPLQ